MHTFTLTISERQLRNLHLVVDLHAKSLKNWIASAVESRDFDRAKELVDELRRYEALYAATNVEAKLDIAKFTSKPVQTDVIVEERK